MTLFLFILGILHLFEIICATFVLELILFLPEPVDDAVLVSWLLCLQLLLFPSDLNQTHTVRDRVGRSTLKQNPAGVGSKKVETTYVRASVPILVPAQNERRPLADAEESPPSNGCRRNVR